MSLSEIRVRDRNTVARLGNPMNDPLLQAEMDRRELLNRLDDIRVLLTHALTWEGWNSHDSGFVMNADAVTELLEEIQEVLND